MQITPNQANKYITHFTNIYSSGEEVNPIPKGVRLTIYFEGSSFEDRGFLFNVLESDLGLEALIAQKWIKQYDLEELINQPH